MRTLDDKNELATSVNDKCDYLNGHEIEKADIKTTNQSQIMTDIPQQNQLFSLQNELISIDPDTLTPKQAHDLLYHLKKIISH